MKSNKQRKVEIKQKRLEKLAKKDRPWRAHRVLVDSRQLSEKSLRSRDIPTHYIDELYHCIDCGIECTFLADQQKDWYEVEKRYFWQRPTRCIFHHDEWRVKRSNKFDMDRRLEALSKNPRDEENMAQCAESMVQFHKDTSNGNLQTALCLLKKLKRTDPFYTYCKDRLTDLH